MRLIVLCGAAAVSLCVLLSAPANAANPPGSYQASCINIRVDGSYLSASCQDISGHYHASGINTRSCAAGAVANNNGQLVCGRGGQGIGMGMPRGSWRASCNNASMNKLMLSASCDNGSGGWNRSSLNVGTCRSQLVGNARGNLYCEGGNGIIGGYLPPGSWRTTCRNGRKDGHMLFAECDTGYGSWRPTSLDLRHCPHGPIGNSGGNLYCIGGSSGRP